MISCYAQICDARRCRGFSRGTSEIPCLPARRVTIKGVERNRSPEGRACTINRGSGPGDQRKTLHASEVRSPPILQGGGKGVTAGVSMPRQQFSAAQRMGGPQRRPGMAERRYNGVERCTKPSSSSVARRRGRTRQTHLRHSSGATTGSQW